MILPDPVLLSIYNLFPRKADRKRALQEIGLALDRISQGEIDGSPRTAEEAISYLRQKTTEAAAELGGREAKWIPMPSTWFHQSRYLRVEKHEELPANLESCIAILALYPNSPSQANIRANVKAFMPALGAISKAVAGLMPQDAVEWLSKRTAMYAGCVAAWPKEDLQYVPSPKRWFEESRFARDERTWVRNRPASYHQEREQIRRLLQS